MKRELKVSAPGSMMVTGEHAVVYGHPAIVCAIEQRIQVTVSALTRRVVEVHSTISAPVTMPLDSIVVEGPMKFVLAVIAQYADQLQFGIRVDVRSDINPVMGLGSSAAVTAASLAAIDTVANRTEKPDFELPVMKKLHKAGLQIIRDIQGRGSGADLAASLHGGMIAYRLPSGFCAEDKDASMQLLPASPQLSLCYVGYKTPTSEVLAKVAAERKGKEPLYDDLYQQMGDCATQTISAARDKDWRRFGLHLQSYQNHLKTLGVSDQALEQLVAEGSRNPDTIAVKISGSGLGDCVLAVGAVPESFTNLTVASDGVRIDD